MLLVIRCHGQFRAAVESTPTGVSILTALRPRPGDSVPRLERSCRFSGGLAELTSAAFPCRAATRPCRGLHARRPETPPPILCAATRAVKCPAGRADTSCAARGRIGKCARCFTDLRHPYGYLQSCDRLCSLQLQECCCLPGLRRMCVARPAPSHDADPQRNPVHGVGVRRLKKRPSSRVDPVTGSVTVGQAQAFTTRRDRDASFESAEHQITMTATAGAA